MTSPSVSVLLPTYRRGAVIRRALETVLSQSFTDFELIVLDDLPGDDTEAVIQSFKDRRVRYAPHPSRDGVAAARNRGLALARGELIAFQDSDDEWLPGKLQQQVDRLRSLPAEFALTQGAVEYAGPPRRYLFSDLPPGQERTACLPVNSTTFLQAWLARKAVLVEVGGFDERLQLWEDWELLIRLCQKYRVDMDPRAMAITHDTPDSLIKQLHRRVPSLVTILEKHRALMEANPRALAVNLYAIARFKLLASEDRDARSLLLESLRLHPARARTWALLGLSLLGRPVLRAAVGWRDATARAPAKN
jgi:glycosyltransferase involved in cell wall biosynthesis